MTEPGKNSRNQRRKRQVYRQLLMGGTAVVFVLALSVGIAIQRHKSADTNEAAQIQAEPVQTEEKAETEKERISRVRKAAKKAGYPNSVVKLLDKNGETVQFVEDYGTKKDAPFADTIGDPPATGEIPALFQWDERWGYAPYGSSIVAVSGCGPTCMSMVVTGLTGDVTVTPDKVAAYGAANGYLDEDNNTLWTFMQEACANWGITAREIALDEGVVREELTAGHPIICSVTKGNFTQDGHFIVLTGYENGVVTVNDSFSKKNSEKNWVFAEITGQIVGMWSYSR